MKSLEKHKWHVCVRCFTFNQAPYIIDTMDGFTQQTTDFPYVCCIVDDASTDGEQEIIKKYIMENFEKPDSRFSYIEQKEYGTLFFVRHKINPNCYFTVVLLEQNHTGNQELKKKKRGYIADWEEFSRYEAICEGDDYWCDNNKLQKQVDFLETHPEYSLCFHAAYFRQNLADTFTFYQPFKKDCDISFQQIVMGGGMFCPTPSIIYRSKDYFEMPDVFRHQHVGDYPLQIYLASKGLVRYMASPMCVYRVASQNSWTQRMKKTKIETIISKEEKLLTEIDHYFSLNYHSIFQRRELLYKYQMYYGIEDYINAFSYAKQMMSKGMNVPLRQLARMLLYKFQHSIH